MIKLDHIAVGVSNLDAAIDFYEQKIGLKFLFKKVDEAHGEAFAYLEMKGARLELLQSLRLPKSRAADDHSFCPHMAFTPPSRICVKKRNPKDLINFPWPRLRFPTRISGYGQSSRRPTPHQHHGCDCCE